MAKSNSAALLQVSIKLASLPFVTDVRLTEEQYIQLFQTYNYRGYDLEGVLVAEMDSGTEIWSTPHSGTVIDPKWEAANDSSEDLEL